MLGKQTRRQRTERIAGQAWDHLTSAVDAAESSVRTAKKRTKSIYEDTSNRIESGSREAKARAQDAYDALLGRRRRGTSWGWLVAATAAGMAAGWVATTLGRRAIDTTADDLATLRETAREDFSRSGM
jgi:hypothetical protein